MLNLTKLKGFVHNTLAIRNFLMEKNVKRNNSKIKVVFLMQFPAVWNKFSPIYELMKKNDAFEPILMCVPDGLRNGELPNPDDLTNATYDYFVSHGYDAVNAIEGPNKWVDLRALSPDYVFF